jgi:hypothetical protein
MTLRTEPLDRDVRTRSAASRVDLGTRYVTVCVVSLVAGRSGGKRYRLSAWSADCGGGGREMVNRKRKLSAVFYNRLKSFIHVTRIAAMHIIFTRIGCTLFTCDIYMCRLRHINDPVLSSLKMEGICLLFSLSERNHLRLWRYIFFCLFVFGATTPIGPWPPHSRGFHITHNDAPQSVGLLCKSDQLVAETST